MVDVGEKEDIEDIGEEGKSGSCIELGEDEMEESYLADMVDLSVEDALSRFGPGAVSMGAEELGEFLVAYKWRPLKTDWEDPKIGESVICNGGFQNQKEREKRTCSFQKRTGRK